MADEKHLEILKTGVVVWNQWRKTNRRIKPDLSGANLNQASLYNADFNRANLQAVNLQSAFLNKVNLKGANLYRANLKNAKLPGANLKGANLEGAILIDVNLEGSILRDANLKSTNFNDAFLYSANLHRALLKNTKLQSANLYNANLNHANLENANLKYAFLYGANLSDANLSGANLQGVNVSKVQALDTNFEGAILTGACIEDWNINGETNFQNLKCDYIYLKGTYSNDKRGWIFSDRRPHDPDKIFAPGEFTKRYQKLLETVDIYFNDGVDWQAFLVSFNKLQVECDSDQLSINSFEHKGNGSFVIKVIVPDSADKAEIERYLNKQYQLEATVEAQQRELTNLYEVTKLLAGRATTEIRNTHIEKGHYFEEIQGNNYQQNGKFGIGNNQGDISDNTKVIGETNQYRQEDNSES
ncbi:MAG: pentapeptide repeat-containing protein [Cyanobacteria bacterium P01_A01_bin.40]